VNAPALLFDVDGTLVDSVYQHVLAWHEALQGDGIELSVWRIHRRIGMSGGLFVDALAREIGVEVDAARADRLRVRHAAGILARMDQVAPLPGAIPLLQRLQELDVPYALATSGRLETAEHTIALLQLPPDVPIVTRDDVAHAKPDPDLFLAAAERLGVEPEDCFVVGDSVWDLLAARRAGSLGVGVLSGGYGRDELERAGAYRVYADPAEMLARLDEAGVRLGEPGWTAEEEGYWPDRGVTGTRSLPAPAPSSSFRRA
jgi:HAD superfamily hydrolase (TIGR01509 family)